MFPDAHIFRCYHLLCLNLKRGFLNTAKLTKELLIDTEHRGSKVLRKVGILPQHYTASQPSEDGCSKVLRNVGILPHHYTASQPSEDGCSKALRNVGILSHRYTVSQPKRPRLNSSLQRELRFSPCYELSELSAHLGDLGFTSQSTFRLP
jgi:hypothetical protein